MTVNKTPGQESGGLLLIICQLAAKVISAFSMEQVPTTSSKCRSSKPGIIGGVFGLAEPWPLAGPKEVANWPFQRKDCYRLANGNSAFWLLARTLQPRKVWLPSFLCCSTVRAFREAGVQVEFFPIDEQLHVADEHWLEEVVKGDLVVRINYFGFRNTDPVFPAAKDRGAWLVDDAAQALLTREIGHDSDFVVYSPRKFVGIPDGGVLVARKPFEILEALRPAPAQWWLEAFSTVLLRREHDQSGASGDWFSRFQHSETTSPVGPFCMSTLSASMLDHCFNFDEIAGQRRRNFLHLSDRLSEWACFPELPDDVVPLGFPIQVDNRELVRQALFENRIFPPVHWPIDGTIPPQFVESLNLSNKIMTLVCDQRFGASDMERTADIFLSCCDKPPRGTEPKSE